MANTCAGDTSCREDTVSLDDRTIGALNDAIVFLTIGVGLVMSDAFVFARRM